MDKVTILILNIHMVVATYLKGNGFQPLSEYEKEQISTACYKSCAENQGEPNPMWEFPWIVADMVFFLRNWFIMSPFSPWGRDPYGSEDMG